MRILSPTIAIDPAVDHIRGRISAPLILLQYGDYECPYCGEAHPFVKQLQQHFADSLCLVFRHFPVPEIHPHAHMAAEAAEAAGVQDKFWEMHNHLFWHQHALEPEDLLQYAEDLGLDDERFARDLASGAMRSRVQRDAMNGFRAGVKGTPAFFINGLRYDGFYGNLHEVLHEVEAS